MIPAARPDLALLGTPTAAAHPRGGHFLARAARALSFREWLVIALLILYAAGFVFGWYSDLPEHGFPAEQGDEK